VGAFCLIGVICFQGTFFYLNFKKQNDAFIVFNKSRFSIIGQKQNDRLIIHHNLDSIKQFTDNVVRNYKVGEMIDLVSTDSLQNTYKYKDKTILVIDSLGVYKSLSFNTDYVLLRNSPKINLNRVIDSLKPKVFIADASNYKTYIKRWKATCIDKKIPFHYTNEKGAFILQ
jgi:competence protein ComEC